MSALIVQIYPKINDRFEPCPTNDLGSTMRRRIEIDPEDENCSEELCFGDKIDNSLKTSERTLSFSSSSSDEFESDFQDAFDMVNLKSCLKSSTEATLDVSDHTKEHLSKITDTQPEIVCKSVSFSKIEIREYNTIVEVDSDKEGPEAITVSLDWEYDNDNVQFLDVDTYEDRRGTKKTQNELKVAAWLRKLKLSREQNMKETKKKSKKNSFKKGILKEQSNGGSKKKLFSSLGKKIRLSSRMKNSSADVQPSMVSTK